MLAIHYYQVDHGKELDRHLTFLIECRGAFNNMNDLKVFIMNRCKLWTYFLLCVMIKSQSFIYFAKVIWIFVVSIIWPIMNDSLWNIVNFVYH